MMSLGVMELRLFLLFQFIADIEPAQLAGLLVVGLRLGFLADFEVEIAACHVRLPEVGIDGDGVSEVGLRLVVEPALGVDGPSVKEKTRRDVTFGGGGVVGQGLIVVAQCPVRETAIIEVGRLRRKGESLVEIGYRLGELQGRNESHAAVEVGGVVVRLDFQGFAVVGDGRLPVVSCRVGETAVVVEVRVLGRQGYGLGIEFDRFIVVALTV